MATTKKAAAAAEAKADDAKTDAKTDAPVADAKTDAPVEKAPEAKVEDAPVEKSAKVDDEVKWDYAAKTVEQENHGWTVQSDDSYVIPEAVPGQVFTEAELPDADAQREAGIDPEAFRALLTVE